MGSTYQRETFEECFEEALPILHRHWQEIAHYPDISLNVDVERYLQAERSGVLRIYTARAERLADADRQISNIDLVGYAVFSVGMNPHYSASKQAVQDVIYVDQSYRRGAIGLGLIRFCEEQLAAEGVQVILHHVKQAHPKLGYILEHKFGYELVDLIYAKRLDKAKGEVK